MKPAPEWVCGPHTRRIFDTNFPPMFEPQPLPVRGAAAISEAATRGRQTALANGHTGTIERLSSATTAMRGDASKAVVR